MKRRRQYEYPIDHWSVGGDAKEKEQTNDVANSECEKKNSGGTKTVVTTVPITRSKANKKSDEAEEAEDVIQNEPKRKKSDEVQKAVI
eukprot:8220824-Ditylum_brightwellii.AAC.1